MRRKRYKKPTVQLTSLLDLLFVMIFVSLIQSKEIPDIEKEAPKAPEVAEKVEPKPKPEPRPKAEPIPETYNLTATFNFYASASNPNLPEGLYAMRGEYDVESGKLSLGGIGWLERPEGYDMVPLSGKIEAGSDIFTGRIEFQECEEFTLRRVERKSKTPISGVWKGQYKCSQGETGLTLTIE